MQADEVGRPFHRDDDVPRGGHAVLAGTGRGGDEATGETAARPPARSPSCTPGARGRVPEPGPRLASLAHGDERGSEVLGCLASPVSPDQGSWYPFLPTLILYSDLPDVT